MCYIGHMVLINHGIATKNIYKLKISMVKWGESTLKILFNQGKPCHLE